MTTKTYAIVTTDGVTERSKRYVRRDRRICADSLCLLCGANWGICRGARRVCRHATCKACGSAQCSANGLGLGQCGICSVGLLSGWSGSDVPCDYTGCTELAVAHVDGINKRRCRAHLERGKWAGYIAHCLKERDQTHIVVDAATITAVL